MKLIVLPVVRCLHQTRGTSATFLLTYERDMETLDFLPALVHMVTIDKKGSIVSEQVDPHGLLISLASQGHDLTQITPADMTDFRERQLRSARVLGGKLPALAWDYTTKRWIYRDHAFPHERLLNAIHAHPRVRINEIFPIDISILTGQSSR